jgi:hypothetical protein
MARKQGERDCVIDEVRVETEERVDRVLCEVRIQEKHEHQCYNTTQPYSAG